MLCSRKSVSGVIPCAAKSRLTMKAAAWDQYSRFPAARMA